MSRKIVVDGLPSFFLHKTRIYARVKKDLPDDSGSFSEKGNPVEKQGRKVSGLRGKTYVSGPPRFDSGTPSLHINKVEVVMLPVTPALEVHSADHTTLTIPLGRLPLSLSPPPNVSKNS